VFFLLSLIAPIFEHVPTPRRAMLGKLKKTMLGLGVKFLKSMATGSSVGNTDRSVIGLLGVCFANSAAISGFEMTLHFVYSEIGQLRKDYT
jgi:hypothetical protein